MTASTTMKRHDLRSLRRLFSRDRIRIPAPAPAPAPAAAITTNAATPSETATRCPACELRAYLNA
jgi:hypothetical protein